MVSVGDGRGEAPGAEREGRVTFWLEGDRRKERKESRVPSLLVALLTRRTQPALGQYLITCTAEQHAIST